MLGLQINSDPAANDLLVARRAAVIAPADGFIAETILVASRGDFKEFPLLGAEAPLMVGGNHDPFWAGATVKMLRACRLPVNSLTLSPEGLITLT